MTKPIIMTRRGFGQATGTSSSKVLAHLSEHKDKTFTAREIAELFELTKSTAKSIVNSGEKAGCLKRVNEPRGLAFQFARMPEFRPRAPKHSTYVRTGKPPGRPTRITRAAGPSKTGDKRLAEKLESKQRMNALNPIKQMTPVDPTPHSAAQKVTVREGYPDHRYWVDPASVPMFRYGSAVAA